jgi:hypothetical protein
MIIKNKAFIFFVFLVFPTIIFFRILSFHAIGVIDAGAPVYIGDMILKGQVPYRDIWEHKTPLIYYLFAFLFKFFGSHFRTISVFEVLWIFITSVVFYKLSRLIFKQKISLCISLIFATYFSAPQVATSFGFRETYAALPVIIAIFCAMRYETMPKKYLLFISGLMVSVAFLFKQTFAISALPIAIYLAINHFCTKKIFLHLILEYSIFSAGVLVPIAIFFVYFFAKGALEDCVSQVFIYNLLYLKNGALPFLAYIKNLIIKTAASPLGIYPFLFIFGISGVLYKLSDFLREIKKKAATTNLREQSLFILILSLFLSDLYMVSLSGYYFEHYYLGMVTSLSLLGGYTLEYFFKEIKPPIRLVYFLVLSFMLSSPWPRNIYDTLGFNKTRNIYLNKKNSINMGGYRYKCDYPLLIKWIMENTAEDDFIYFWGCSMEINFFTKRPSPTKYPCIYQFLTPGYLKSSYLKRFILDLKKNKPKFIIDAVSAEFLPVSLQYIADRNYSYNNLLLPVIEFIKDNYIYETTIEGLGIYRRK